MLCDSRLNYLAPFMHAFCCKPLFDKPHQGFSLLELSVVMVIIAVMAGSGMVVGKATLESAQIATTNTRLNTIETALLSFRRANDRLPCPGDATALQSSANYGKEASAAGDCKTTGSPVTNYSASVGGSTIVEGSLPTKALSLPDEFMYDGWGRKFAYSVWAPATAQRGFVNYGISSNCGMESIRNSVGMARSNNGIYTLVSYGPNGHGAYNEMGQRLTSQSANTDEHTNCHCGTNGVDTGYLGTYVDKDRTENPNNSLDVFDDIVRYKERWQLQNYFDEYNPGGYLICPSTGPGVRTYGLAVNDYVGTAEAVGDLNGDGIKDFIIGIPRRGTASAGSVAVVFGKANGVANPLPLSGLDGTNGFMINSLEVSDWAGSALAVGDFNNDGIQDVIIGAPHSTAGKGKVYVVFGHVAPWTPTVNLATLAGTDGFAVVNNIAGINDALGSSVAAGDLTYDGRDDLVIGAPGTASNKGSVYIIKGRTGAWSASNTLSSLISSEIDGGTGEAAGSALAVADVNGDGLKDLIVGLPGDGVSMPGSVIIRFGMSLGFANTNYTTLTGYNGYRLVGETNGDLFGSALGTGDVDGNYINDIVIGAPGYSSNRGAAYIYFGTTARKPLSTQIAKINGFNGTRLTGATAGDKAGTAVGVADLNGDGYGDVIVGAPGASPGGLVGAGSTYVMMGQASGWTPTLALSSVDGTTGYILNGSTAGDSSGSSLAIGDLDNDYITDIIIGAPNADYTFTNSGAVYLYYGQRKDPPWSLTTDLNSM